MKIKYLDQANSLANKIGNLKIATNSKQSDRLIALGIKIETADCFIRKITETDDWSDYNTNHSLFEPWMNKENIIKSMFKPAWSLTRILELLPSWITNSTVDIELNIDASLSISYRWRDIGGIDEYVTFDKGNIYDNACDTIEWLIKEGYLDKYYLT